MQFEEPPAARGIHALIVDSERALAQGLAQALSDQPGVASASAAGDRAAAMVALDQHAVDVVVAATDVDGWDPFAFMRDVDVRTPRPAVVAISGDDDPVRVTAAIVAGALSWVPKQVSLDRLASVVVAAARGESWLPPAVLARVLRRLAADRHEGPPPNPVDRLTFREQQILRYIARGLSRREIATELDVSVNTVRSHSRHVLSKLGVHSTLEAVALVLRGDNGTESDPL